MITKCVQDYGAIGDGITDDTLAVEEWLNDAGKETCTAVLEEKKIYKTTREISICIDEKVELLIDGKNSMIKPTFGMETNCGVKTPFLFHPTGNQEDGIKLEIKNLTIDSSSSPYFAPTTETDLRGIGAIRIYNIPIVNIENYNVNGCYFASGLGIYRHTTAYLKNIRMTDVGTKYKPHENSTAGVDMAGDALYFEITKTGETTVENFEASTTMSRLGRAGIVFENFQPELQIQHNVFLNNVSLYNYQRTIHEEDHASCLVKWNGGVVTGFSKALMTWCGTKGYECKNVQFDVNPPFMYGFGMGLVGAGDPNNVERGLYLFKNCIINYLGADCIENGAQLFEDCLINLNAYVVKDCSTLQFKNTNVVRTDGYIRIQNDGDDINVLGGTWENKGPISCPSVMYSMKRNVNVQNTMFIGCEIDSCGCCKCCCCDCCNTCPSQGRCRYLCYIPCCSAS